MKRVVLLGSTGSIGESALRVVETLGDRVRVVGLCVQRRWEQALAQAARFGVDAVAVCDDAAAEQARREAPDTVTVHGGAEAMVELVETAGADIVVCAVVGMAGLRPVMAAAERGIDIALATKEVLVAAGEPVVAACRRSGARLLPVDSEHSAIFQCLHGATAVETRGVLGSVRRLLLTASGGPFAARAGADLDTVTVEEALNHPRWSMGPKVTIDSATLMNKGLEIIEAHWLFGVPYDGIDVVIHPESIVHSFVEFVDGTLLAQLSVPDMRFAVQYALTYPDRCDGGLPPLDVASLGALRFSPPDPRRFPCLRLAREAARRGGTLPAVLNAANEVAVGRFLAGVLPFPGIWETVERVMERHAVEAHPDLQALVAADAWARDEAARETQRLEGKSHGHVQ
jgi:1-deoxy-D-xylulose-5-phosphate reductoisomerase